MLTVVAYRASHNSCHDSPLPVDPREAYHALCPHPALSPVPSDPASVAALRRAESAYRHIIVHAILELLLPVDDYQNDCLRALVGEIFAEMVIGEILIGRAGRSEVWYEGIIKGIEVWKRTQMESKTKKTDRRGEIRLSGNATFFAQLTRAIRLLQRYFFELFAQMLHYSLLILAGFRFLIYSVATSFIIPSRLPKKQAKTSGDHYTDSSGNESLNRSSSSFDTPPPKPIITLSMFTTISLLAELPTRRPWLLGVLQLLQHFLLLGPGKLGASDGLLDR